MAECGEWRTENSSIEAEWKNGGRMAEWSNGGMARMAEWHMEWGNDGWNGRMTDGMAEWQNGIMA